MAWRKVFYWIGLALGLALFSYQVWIAIVALRVRPLAVATPGLLLGVVGLDILAYILLMAGWAAIMASIGVRLPARVVAEGYLLSFLPRYIPGTIWGYLSRSEWLAQREAVPYAKSGKGSLLEVSMQVMTACIAVAVYWAPAGWKLVAGVAVLGVSAVLWLVLLRMRRDGHAQMPVRPTWRGWAFVVGTYLVFWGVHGAATCLVAIVFGAGQGVDWLTATYAFCASWLIGFLVIFVPAGLGVREWSLTAILESALGMTAGPATLVAVVTRLGIVVAELILLLVGLSLYSADWLRARKDGEHGLAD